MGNINRIRDILNSFSGIFIEKMLVFETRHDRILRVKINGISGILRPPSPNRNGCSIFKPPNKGILPIAYPGIFKGSSRGFSFYKILL